MLSFFRTFYANGVFGGYLSVADKVPIFVKGTKLASALVIQSRVYSK